MKTFILLNLLFNLFASAQPAAHIPSKEELKKSLSAEQYSCTQEEGTEQPFKNPYWDQHADGIYIDLISGEPLFSSLDKYDSGTGWPSFTKPLESENIQIKKDTKLGQERNEVRSKKANSHLGHVFDDGPQDKGGKRYCMNSASLKFIPFDQMKEKGYGKYLFLFAKKRNLELAVLSGGCFWGMEKLIEAQKGVIETRVGYAAPVGDLKKIAESVQILFDPKKTSYEDILLFYFKAHDPTTKDSQGNDRGPQYRSAIFYSGAEQLKQAEKIKKRVDDSGAWKAKVVTEVVPLGDFKLAEESHQKYLTKNPHGYTCHYIRNLKF